jgi:hypothetical protein
MAAVDMRFTVVRSMIATRTFTADIAARGLMLAAIAERVDLLAGAVDMPATEAADSPRAGRAAAHQPEVTRVRVRALSAAIAAAEMLADFRREDNPALADRTAVAGTQAVAAATVGAGAGASLVEISKLGEFLAGEIRAKFTDNFSSVERIER